MQQLSTEMATSLKQGWRLARPFITPEMVVKFNGQTINLWVTSRKFPALLTRGPYSGGKNAIIAPVGPDLKMVTGAAKLIRDQGADRAQYAALKAAPMGQGKAFLAEGGKYRYNKTVLAVIFDARRRTTASIISQAVRTGAELASAAGCTGLIIPDLTANLVVQSNWISEAQRESAASLGAAATVAAIKACKATMSTYHVWCWDPLNAVEFRRELDRLQR
jgi:hypothetical protein